jgi:hypothetical protein
VDGAGALLKKEIRTEHLKADGRKLQNAAEIVQCETLKFFWQIPKVG